MPNRSRASADEAGHLGLLRRRSCRPSARRGAGARGRATSARASSTRFCKPVGQRAGRAGRRRGSRSRKRRRSRRPARASSRCPRGGRAAGRAPGRRSRRPDRWTQADGDVVDARESRWKQREVLEGAGDAELRQPLRRHLRGSACRRSGSLPAIRRGRAPLMTLSSELLPAPFGPITARISPGATARLTPCQRPTPPNDSAMSARRRCSVRLPGARDGSRGRRAALDLAARRRMPASRSAKCPDSSCRSRALARECRSRRSLRMTEPGEGRSPIRPRPPAGSASASSSRTSGMHLLAEELDLLLEVQEAEQDQVGAGVLEGDDPLGDLLAACRSGWSGSRRCTAPGPRSSTSPSCPRPPARPCRRSSPRGRSRCTASGLALAMISSSTAFASASVSRAMAKALTPTLTVWPFGRRLRADVVDLLARSPRACCRW